MGIFWQSRFPWITLMKKSLCAHCIGGQNCYPDNTLIDLLKPKVSFMLMRLNLLKEQDWSHFVALPVAAGRVEQAAPIPSCWILCYQEQNCSTGCLPLSHSQFTEVNLLIWVLRLAFHCTNLALVRELELVEVRVHFDGSQKNQQSQVCEEKRYLLLAPVIGLADRHGVGAQPTLTSDGEGKAFQLNAGWEQLLWV